MIVLKNRKEPASPKAESDKQHFINNASTLKNFGHDSERCNESEDQLAKETATSRIKITTIRNFYEGKYQFGTDAAAEESHYLNERVRDDMEKAELILDGINACRRIQGLEPLRRITASHVRKAHNREA